MDISLIKKKLADERWPVLDTSEDGSILYPGEYVAGVVGPDWSASPVTAADLLTRWFPDAHVEVTYIPDGSDGRPASRFVVFPDGKEAIQQGALGALFGILMTLNQPDLERLNERLIGTVGGVC